MKEKNYAKAEAVFNGLLSTPNLPATIDREEIEWNHLLTLLNTKGPKSDAFRKELNGILGNEGHTYHTKAQQLLGKLDSFWRSFLF